MMPLLADIQSGLCPQRVIALDWHDGPLSGLVEYGDPVRILQFTMVGDPLTELKIFALRNSSLSSLDQLAVSLSMLGPPHWPVWAPNWQFRSDEERTAAEAVITSASDRSEPVVGLLEALAVKSSAERA